MKITSLKYKIAICILCLFTLASCKGLKRLHYLSPEIIPVIKDNELNDANYLARYLMSAEERIIFESQVREEELKKYHSNSSLGIGIAGATALGQNPLTVSGSNTATDIMLAVDAVGIIMDAFEPDGSLDMVSKIYIPSEIHDVSMIEVDDATNFARDYLKEQVEIFAKNEVRNLECVYGCESQTTTIYKLTKKQSVFKTNKLYDSMRQGSDIAGGEYYDPPQLFIITIRTELTKSKPDPIRDRILGFSPMWESSLENGWQTHFAEEFILNENGEIKFMYDGKLGKIPSGWKYGSSSETTPIARRFFRTLTGRDKLIYRGRSNIHVDQFAFKGKVYGFRNARPDNFMQYEISPETDVNMK